MLKKEKESVGGICTFLPCIVAVFVLKVVLTYPEIKLQQIIPLFAQYFWVELTIH